ncbi:MAG: helix-turn-helix transcriptional regulator [Pirellulaceae bacterium]
MVDNVLYFSQLMLFLIEVSFIMPRSKQELLPKQTRKLAQVGEQLRLARLRRRLSAEKVAERAGIARSTLSLIENGSGSSSIETLFRVLSVLGLEDDYLSLAKDDELGRRLADAKLKSPRKRAPKRKSNDSNS